MLVPANSIKAHVAAVAASFTGTCWWGEVKKKINKKFILLIDRRNQ